MGSFRVFLAFVVFCAAYLMGCRHAGIPLVTVAPTPVITPVMEQGPKPLELVVPEFDSAETIYAGLNKTESVIEFYKLMKYRTAWLEIREPRLTSLGDSLVRFIENARYQGLLPRNYHLREIRAGLEDRNAVETILRRDVLLMDAFLTLANDLQAGRMAASSDRDDSLHRRLLLKVVENGGLHKNLELQEPHIPAYMSLKRNLQQLLDSTEGAARKLLLEGAMFDSMALHRRIRSLEINMERWRWERGWAARYVFVNIPSFLAWVIENDSVMLESRVIVGKPENPTPQLSSTIECFITYPYWHVPRKIAIEELLPAIRRDRSYVHKNNFDVLDRRGNLLDPDSVPWGKFHKDNFPVVLRQREGPENSLGILKFVFDSPYAVFLHDTNARRLFQNKNRALSHGCIRMEKASQFAHYLLTGDVERRSAMLDKHVQEKVRHSIDIPTPIPIYVRYFTADVVAGQLVIFADLYKKDQALIDTLYAPQAGYYY